MTAVVLATLAALSRQQVARIDAIVGTVMRQERVEGLSLGVARGRSTLYLRGYGFRNSAGLRADGYTIYAVGSIAKQFTAALVLQEVARGRLDLDGGNPPVRSLLDQTTGGRWGYSNENYVALGKVLERVTAMPYCALLQARVLEPLRLPSTSCAAPATWNLAAATAPSDEPIAPAAGGLWSNAADLLRWLAALRDGTIVTKPLFDAMTTSATLPNGVPVNYGFGFFVDDWYGYRVVHHDGFVAGFSCLDALEPDDGLELVLLSNRAALDLVPLAKSIVAIVQPARDRNLSAAAGGSPENENQQITADLAALLQTHGFAARGSLLSLEFIERNRGENVVDDTYRATFTNDQVWVVVEYDARNDIESLRILPITR
jgi:CubicO group peptidase (beta-lactamase class C family)